jgi:anthranilate phosphoribosyltransferase
MFAPAHHGAMKYAVGPRKELGMRTLFNVLGPLTNPARVTRQVLGVYDAALCEPLARALQQLGSTHALVLHSEDGLDEISVATSTHGVELKSGELTPIRIEPGDYGHGFDSLDGLQVKTADASAALIQSAFAGDQDGASCKARAIIALNAGAGIYVSGGADNLAGGIARADEALGSGAAAEKLAEFVSFTQRLSAETGGG